MGQQNEKTKKIEKILNLWRPRLRFYSDEFVFDTVSGMFYRLSPTAGMLLKFLDKETNKEDLITLIQEKYDVPRLNALRDIELFLNDLAALDILVPSDPRLPTGKKQ